MLYSAFVLDENFIQSRTWSPKDALSLISICLVYVLDLVCMYIHNIYKRANRTIPEKKTELYIVKHYAK